MQGRFARSRCGHCGLCNELHTGAQPAVRAAACVQVLPLARARCALYQASTVGSVGRLAVVLSVV